MDWTQQVDNYCERMDFTFWGEPLNAITNAAFLIAAFIAWRVAKREGRLDPGIWALIAVLTAIGIGSFLFHTFATRWAAMADVLPILFYILIYIYLATTRFLALPWWGGVAALVLFVPYAGLVGWAVGAVFGPLNGSVGYIPVPILIAIYAFLIRKSAPQTARGLMIGVAILAVSLTMRTIDEATCAAFPIGTHIFWHIFNGIMLGWMIVVMARHPRAT
jgi:hypothetical protein